MSVLASRMDVRNPAPEKSIDSPTFQHHNAASNREENMPESLSRKRPSPQKEPSTRPLSAKLASFEQQIRK